MVPPERAVESRLKGREEKAETPAAPAADKRRRCEVIALPSPPEQASQLLADWEAKGYDEIVAVYQHATTQGTAVHVILRRQ